jgi:small GTP-binding protein
MADKKIKSVKLIIVGESHVGKTSLIHQFIEGTFDEGTIQTIGRGEKNIKEIPLKSGEKVYLEIWDTAGQERFRTLNKIFIKDAKIILLVYDITDKKSFDEIVTFWYKDIISQLDNCKNLVIGLAGNKSDLYKKQEVDLIEAQEYAKSINAIFKETSAKNSDAVEEIFYELAEKYHELNKDKNKDNDNQNIKLKPENKNEKEKNVKKCCK